MAGIIRAQATSHMPTIGYAVDRDRRCYRYWPPIFRLTNPEPGVANAEGRPVKFPVTPAW